MRARDVDQGRRAFLGRSTAALAGVAAARAGVVPAGLLTVQTPTPGPSEPVVIGYANRMGLDITRVVYPNAGAGTRIAANLFKPAGFDPARKYPAILVGHPFGGVKEQTAGLHAARLAELGYVTVAFDASHYGDSTGEPRYYEVPETKVSDFSAGVDYLTTLPFLDLRRIGVLGVCGSGGYAVSATAVDHRIRALATVSMYDMGRARRQGLGDTIGYEQRMATLAEIGEQRTREARGEPRRDIGAIPETITESTPATVREFYDYYRTPRGQHRHSTNRYAFVSLAPMMNFFPFAQIETIAPRPLLMIVGERAASAYFSEDAYRKAAEPKELFVVPSATHVDLYDRAPFLDQSVAKLHAFFGDHLASRRDGAGAR